MKHLQELKKLLPSWYEGIYETDVLMSIEQSLFEDLMRQIIKSQENQYVSTADSDTITLYEQMLGITVNLLDPLELRRFRVLTRLTTQKPYTMRYLKEALSSFGDPATLTMLYDEYRLLVKMNFEKVGQVSEIEYIFRSVVPANILIDARNDLKTTLPKNQLFLAAGMVNTELITISQDVQASAAINVNIYQPLGMVVSDLEQLSQDVKAAPRIDSQPKSANAMVSYQTVEIKERGE